MISRLKRLRKIMSSESIPALFVTNSKNIYYLTGISTSVGALTVTPDEAILFVDERYSELALEKAKKHFVVKDSSEMLPYLHSLKKFAYEGDSVSVDQYKRWQSIFMSKKLVHTNELIKGLRRIKDQEEIRSIVSASRITKKVLRMIPNLLSAGISELDLSRRIKSECLRLGADSMAFETIVGFGANTSRPHHYPTSRKFAFGDLVQIDMGAMVSGYCSDFSRVFFTGPVSSDQKRAFSALNRAKKSVEKLLKAGVSIHFLDNHVRSILREYSYDSEFCHALGHGLGLEIHEGVTISTKRPDVKLRKGDVITIEPGLYFPGKFGMRIEDTHVIG